MSIFQKSVVNKYLKTLDENAVNQAFEQFIKFYGNLLRRMNIVTLNEENYQEGFLREIFVNVLGYTINPDVNYNLTTEYKNQTDNKKADGAILKNGNAIAVIELKSTKTPFIESITKQAFNYKNNQPNCPYVITSNFHHLRFFIDNATENEHFDLFEMADNKDIAEFKRFYLFLCKDNLINDLPLKLKEETKFLEENITEKFYRDYKQFKDQIFENLIKNNPQYDKLTLFKKSQKLLDRFIFIWFAEDCGLVPPNAISRVIDQWKQLIDLEKEESLFSRFQLMFNHLNVGHKFKNYELSGYNGGLFKFDEILDNSELRIDDNVLLDDCLKLSGYDFSSELNVNILGHVFEHSLNEIEEITAEINGENVDKSKTKRKKEGIFYTPEYITKYIIESTLGKLCEEQKKILKINNVEISDKYRDNNKLTEIGKELYDILFQYKNWLFTLKILDPACGSGAFLIQALDYLISEHKQIDELISELTGDKIPIFETDKAILEQNIFGVDINDESVEISKLSLWLRTAKKDRKLSDLSDNIKCGNSLINNSEIASNNAFDWNKEFPEIMQNGGFDIVIGNPPYVFTREKINELEKEFYLSNYQTSQYQANLYILFIEKGYQLLKNQGFLGFIVPNAWLMISSGEKLREFLLNYTTINNIVNFTGETFEQANVEPVILCFKKESATDYNIEIYNNELEEFILAHQINSREFAKNQAKEFTIYLDEESNKIIKKIKKNSINLNDVTIIKSGLKAYEKGKGNPPQTPYHIMKRPYDFKYKYDKNTHKYLEGKNVLRYEIKWTDNWLQYTEQLAAPRTFDIFNGKKIIIREIAGKFPKSIIAVYTEELYLFNMSNIAVIDLPDSKLDLQYILALLNSKLMSFYFLKNTAKSVRALFPKIILNDLRKFPIKEIDWVEQQPFIEKTKIIQEQKELLNKESNKFSNYLQSKYGKDKITEKLENWYELSDKDFFAELTKNKIKPDVKEQIELLSHFKEQKINIQQIVEAINITDNEIDRMVCNLYELTENEIKLIEGNK